MKIAKPYKILLLLLLISFGFVIANTTPHALFQKLNRSFTLHLIHLHSASDIERLKSENRKLREIASLYEVEMIKLREIAKENERLRKRLELKLPSPSWKAIWAEIQEVYSQELVIDKGGQDGIEKGSPVVSADLLVGRISQVWQNKATVSLLTHSEFSAGIEFVRSSIEGVGVGVPLENAVYIKYIPKKSDVRAGDEIITSGRGGIFPSGLRIGEVADIVNEPFGFFLVVKVKPYLNLPDIQDVVILTKIKG